MLKGHVFSKQIFGNPIFALFINTFLNGENGVSNNYKNGMKPTYSGSTISIDSGAVCIQGRFLEEDTSTSVQAGTNNAYCKLVVEIDLDKQNTESKFNQASYKIITATSNYPVLTQTNIVKNNSGIYQYELARFKTSTSGITDFQDMRTYLDFDSIFDEIRADYNTILQELKQSLADVKDGSDYLLKSAGGAVEGEIKANGGLSGELIPAMLLDENLNDLKTTGFYYAYGGNTVSNKPAGINNFSLLVTKTGNTAYSQILVDDKGNIFSRTSNGSSWYEWLEYFSDKSIAILTGTMTNGQASIKYPNGYNKDNCVVSSVMLKRQGLPEVRGYSLGSTFSTADGVSGSLPCSVELRTSEILLKTRAIYIASDGTTLVSNINFITNYKIMLTKI